MTIVVRASPGPVGGLLPALLGPDQRRFWDEHYLRRPYARPGGAAPWCDLLGDERVWRLVEESACDLTVVRDGHLHPGARPRTRAEALEHARAGSSLVFRHAERHDAVLAAVGRQLTDDLEGVLDAHVYLTPAEHFSFGWHYDAEEVFFLHLAGVKDFYLRENTVQADPLFETMPRDLGFGRERTPVLHCRLGPGDWLYIPHGWWHLAEAQSDSRSLSLGLLVPHPLMLLETLRRELAHDPRWRRRLPPSGGAVPPGMREAASPQATLAALAADLAARFAGLLDAAAGPAPASASDPVLCDHSAGASRSR